MLEIGFLQFLADVANPQLAFLPRALVAAVLASVLCAVVGCFVVLRGMAFIGDAVAHAVFPGVAIAFALHASVLLGGAVAGAVVAVVIAVLSQRRTIKEDAIIGIVFAAAFAFGLVIISRVEGYTASLSAFLFGSLTGVSVRDLWVSGVTGAVIIALVAALRPWLTAVALDRETARAMNLPVAALDLVLYLCVTAAVVISVQTIGNILVIALLVTPASAARLFTDNLETMMVLAALIGIVGSVLGVWLAWSFDSPTGATIVLCVTAIFGLSWLFAPRRGVLRAPGRTPRKETV
ncbi:MULTISPECIES: anchored repeat-type ABC transporter permease subunit [Corynebacterium]|uniref:Anchored repeat-type ABC transporter permease subunit n=1 Tax=Corynebacterium hadale TaxID=2026255 RepID=A0A269PFX8_9CORY|nr:MULTISPECIES: anchored repeat-type ABC transporter permease subunit [Corynebacterium]PAJ71171.1 anchored repeat-type ABC transporter permease subunit [Corynebacterium hadale]PAT04343.1 anchored repeat-type ABC transporter permease subunit [Corynebacterium sp. NML 150383]PAT13145.1 anchored repeat-type ABC transporter permease subunit [Corynebacterium hadale]TVX82625.1 anchored repeat-type ABC transporter permease subunit [Corynebacterium sp. NML180780]WKC59219.1 Manganese transport system m